MSTRSVLLMGISVFATSLSSYAVAQDSQSDRVSAFDEVIVTAQKREQSANDVGVSITAISGDALRQLGINDTTALAESVAGMTFSDTGFAVPVYTIRGVGFSENSVQAQSTVGVYNDQVAVPYPIMTKGLLMDVERLEVLKGPQGTLFGRNSTGGAINYIFNKPTEDYEASVTAGYSSFETVDLEGMINLPLGDKMGLRLTARTIQSGEGWQESVSRDDTHGEQDKFSARLILEAAPTDDLNILFSASTWTDNSDTQVPQNLRYRGNPGRALVDGFNRSVVQDLFGTDDNQAAEWPGGINSLGDGPVADMSSTAMSLTVDWNVSDNITLTSLSSFSEFENYSTYSNNGNPGIPINAELDGVPLLDSINPLSLPFFQGLDTVGGVWYTNDASIEAFSQELRLSGDADRLNWVAGVYYSQDDVFSDTPQAGENATSVQRYNVPAGPFRVGLTEASNATQQEAESWAVFGQAEYELSDALKLTAGLRYTEEDKSYEGCTADTGLGDGAEFVNIFLGALSSNTAVAGGCMTLTDGAFGQVVGELKEDSLSGKIALDYVVNDDLLTYVSFSRGFKGGSFPTFTSTDGRQLLPVTQERLDAYEAGFKATLLEGQMQLNAAAFYYDYKDKQLLSKITLPIFGAVNALANAPKSEVMGAEFDMKWAITDGLFASVTGAYTDTEAKDFLAYNQFGLEGDMSGSAFPLSPKVQLSALVNYETPIGNDLMGFVTGDIAYSDSSASDYAISEVLDSGRNGRGYPGTLASLGATVGQSFGVQPEFQLPATTLLGAQIGVRSDDDKWSLALWGRNLTNEYRVNNSRASSDYLIAWTGMPRTYGATLNYNF